jgi:exodeoxyribonuclease-3
LERTPKLWAFLRTLDADCVILTEYRDGKMGSVLRDLIAQDGYPYVVYSSCARGVLIAARCPFDAKTNPGALASDGAGILRADFPTLTVYGLYLPQGERKSPHFEYLIQEAERLLARNVICIGDFNTGRNDLDIERSRDLVKPRNGFTSAAQFLQLEEHWTDVWRHLNPDGDQYSWYSRGYRSGLQTGWRIDHCLVSSPLVKRIRDARYVHEPRAQGWTDHSALLVEIAVSLAT